MPAQRWTEEQIAQAIAIAAASGAAEASRQTGIPAGTIRSWLHRRGCNAADRCNGETQGSRATQRRTPKMRQLEEEVRERAVQIAVERVADQITERLGRLADRLYTLAEKAAVKVEAAIADRGERVPGLDGKPVAVRPEPHDRDGAAWVRALVGVMAQAIDKAQLLSGKPTARPEVVDRREIHITQRIISEHPELIDHIFAEDFGPGLEDRGGQGARPGLGQLR
ncbi:MAG: hypothetical protein DIU70_003610 [Bacillota bacterium]